MKLPQNNIKGILDGKISDRIDALRFFIKSHKALYLEYNAVRIESRFFSKEAYIFLKVEDNIYSNFIENNPYVQGVNEYHRLVCELVQIIEDLKIH